MHAFAFEPNTASTWTRVRAMIADFPHASGKMGADRHEAGRGLSCDVGLGTTMTAQDVLDGILIVEVRIAVIRPAEFIVLRLRQQMLNAYQLPAASHRTICCDVRSRCIAWDAHSLSSPNLLRG